jgi:hypothetical protein
MESKISCKVLCLHVIARAEICKRKATYLLGILPESLFLTLVNRLFANL